MQVVYSGGSTPNPSPRLQRKTGYGRPVMPGYMTNVHPQILVQRSREKLTEGDITLRDSIPAMSRSVAVLCLILNILLPGSGTLMAGLSVLCCSHVRPKDDSKTHCIWVNAGVALVQFLLTFLFLLGWIWSVMWGMAFLSVSKQYYYRREDSERRHIQREAKVKHVAKPAPDPRDEGNSTSIMMMMENHNHQNNHECGNHRLESDGDTKEGYFNKKDCDENKLECDGCKNERDFNRQDSDGHKKEDYCHRHNPEFHNRPGSQQTRMRQHSIEAGRSLDTDHNTPPQTPETNRTNPGDKLSSVSPFTNLHEIEATSLSLQPILVLKPVPAENQFDTSSTPCHTDPDETVLKAKTRHLKMMQRKMSDNDLSPFVLTHRQLEAIVIHAVPVNVPDSRQSDTENQRDALHKC